MYLDFTPYSFSFNPTFFSSSSHSSKILRTLLSEHCWLCCTIFFFHFSNYYLVTDKNVAFTVTVLPICIPGLTFIFQFCTKTSIYMEDSKGFQNWSIIYNKTICIQPNLVTLKVPLFCTNTLTPAVMPLLEASFAKSCVVWEKTVIKHIFKHLRI